MLPRPLNSFHNFGDFLIESGAVTSPMCALALDLSTEARNAFFALRSSKTKNHSFVMRADWETLKIELIADYPEGKSLDDIGMALPSTEPRFIVILPERQHPDGRKSYPIVMCAYCPQGMSPQVNIVYSNARTVLARDFQIQHIWDVHKKLALGDEELIEKFAANKW